MHGGVGTQNMHRNDADEAKSDSKAATLRGVNDVSDSADRRVPAAALGPSRRPDGPDHCRSSLGT